MYYRYRRNADEDIRNLEHRVFGGDLTLLPRLVRAYMHAGNFSLIFLQRYPESFQYLTEEWQDRMRQETEQLALITGLLNAPMQQQEEIGNDYCNACLIPEHDECSLTPGCPCCDNTLANIEAGTMPFVDEDDEDEDEDDEDEDEDEELEAAKEAGLNWECDSCGSDDFYEGNRGETWEILTEASAAITNAKIDRGTAGAAMCEDCLNEAGLDLEEAREEELEGYCLECGESLEDCECSSNSRYY